jgi:hypothetical protein
VAGNSIQAPGGRRVADILLHCEYFKGYVDLELHLGDVDGCVSRGRIRIEFRDCRLVLPVAVCGADLLRFADRLSALHRDLDGRADLLDLDNQEVLSFTVADRGRGAIAVGGTWEATWPALPWIESVLQRPGHGGMVMAFEGLCVDQSYLPRVVESVRDFIAESRIVTRAHGLE